MKPLDRQIPELPYGTRRFWLNVPDADVAWFKTRAEAIARLGEWCATACQAGYQETTLELVSVDAEGKVLVERWIRIAVGAQE